MHPAETIPACYNLYLMSSSAIYAAARREKLENYSVTRVQSRI